MWETASEALPRAFATCSCLVVMPYFVRGKAATSPTAYTSGLLVCSLPFTYTKLLQSAVRARGCADISSISCEASPKQSAGPHLMPGLPPWSILS